MPIRRFAPDAETEICVSDETIAGTSHGSAGDETEVVPPVTEAAPELAWSHDEPETEVLPRPWRSAWVIAGVGVASATVIALVVVGIGVMTHRDKEPAHPQAASAPTRAAPTKPPAGADEYVAIAISPRAVSLHAAAMAGFGTGSNQDRANQVALSECRAATGNGDCLLVNDGMYHGCVSYAIGQSENTWVGGFGADPGTATADALRRLGVSASRSWVQCSDPPGILKHSSPSAASSAATAPLPPPPPPSAVMPSPVPPDLAFSGRYTLTETWQSGNVVSEVVNVVSCGTSCVDITPEDGGSTAEAQLHTDQDGKRVWAFSHSIADTGCPGSHGGAAFIVNAETLTGTVTKAFGAVCGQPSETDVDKVSLTKAE